MNVQRIMRDLQEYNSTALSYDYMQNQRIAFHKYEGKMNGWFTYSYLQIRDNLHFISEEDATTLIYCSFLEYTIKDYEKIIKQTVVLPKWWNDGELAIGYTNMIDTYCCENVPCWYVIVPDYEYEGYFKKSDLTLI